jgi:hypothetical protein
VITTHRLTSVAILDLARWVVRVLGSTLRRAMEEKGRIEWGEMRTTIDGE